MAEAVACAGSWTGRIAPEMWTRSSARCPTAVGRSPSTDFGFQPRRCRARTAKGSAVCGCTLLPHAGDCDRSHRQPRCGRPTAGRPRERRFHAGRKPDRTQTGPADEIFVYRSIGRRQAGFFGEIRAVRTCDGWFELHESSLAKKGSIATGPRRGRPDRKVGQALRACVTKRRGVPLDRAPAAGRGAGVSRHSWPRP